MYRGSQRWLPVAAAVAVICGTAGMVLCALHWTRGAPWGVNGLVLMGVEWSSDILGFTIGVWWWRRAW